MSYVSPTTSPWKPPRPKAASNTNGGGTTLFNTTPTYMPSSYDVYGVLGSGNGATVLLGTPQVPDETTTGSFARASSVVSSTSSVLENAVALKVISKSFAVARRSVRRTEMEYSILTTIPPHPHIVNLIATVHLPTAVCFVLELCPRGSLRDLLGILPGHRVPGENLRRAIAAEVLSALMFLHANGIIYRDLKPDNILVREDGSLCVADFDLATFVDPKTNRAALRTSSQNATNREGSEKADTVPVAEPPSQALRHQWSVDSASATGSGGSGSHRGPPTTVENSVNISPHSRWRRESGSSQGSSLPTRPNHWRAIAAPNVSSPAPPPPPAKVRRGSFVGTPGYMAPEVASGDIVQSCAVDMWSFGILLFELTYGVTAFHSTSEEDMLHRLVHHERVPVPAEPPLSKELKDLLAKLLQKDPSRRPTAQQVASHPWFGAVEWYKFTDRTPALSNFVRGAATTDVVPAEGTAVLSPLAGSSTRLAERLATTHPKLHRVAVEGHTSTSLEAYCSMAMPTAAEHDPTGIADNRVPDFLTNSSSRGSDSSLSSVKALTAAQDAFAFFDTAPKYSAGALPLQHHVKNDPHRRRGTELFAFLVNTQGAYGPGSRQ